MRFHISRKALTGLAGGKRGIRAGDLIRKVTEAFGVKPCGGCKKRQESLNRIYLRW